MSQEHTVRLANEALYVNQDITFQSRRFGNSQRTITWYDRVHHHQTFVCSGPTFTRALHPTNISIQQHSILPNTRAAGIHDLLGTDPIWAGAMISNGQQIKRYLYEGEYHLDITIVLYLTGCSE
jgi:hypothetical protein